MITVYRGVMVPFDLKSGMVGLPKFWVKDDREHSLDKKPLAQKDQGAAGDPCSWAGVGGTDSLG